MKMIIINACSAITLGCLVPLVAQTAGPGSGSATDHTGGAASGSAGVGVPTDRAGSSETDLDAGGFSRPKNAPQNATFTAGARSTIIDYFESHRNAERGLPPEIASKMRVRDLPESWKTSIEPGSTIKEDQRAYLLEAPADLTRKLPAAPSGVRYYIAGSNVVAVNKDYKVIDTVQIPTVKLK